MPTKTFPLSIKVNNVSHTDAGDGEGAWSGSNANDQHLPVGLSEIIAGGVFFWRPLLLKFTLDFSDVISITSAKLKIKTSSGVHAGGNDSISIRIRRVTESWSEHGGSEGVYSGAREDPSTTSSGEVNRTPSTVNNTWNSLDITAIVQSWFGGSTNHGIELAYVSAGNKVNEFRSGETDGNDPYIELTYVSNTAPDAPTLTSPAAAAVLTDATPNLSFTHNDDDGDALVSYDLQVSTDSDFSSVTHWDVANSATGISGDNVTRTYAGTALTRGTTYYWRARTNDGTVDGAWSSARSFVYNALPTVTKNSPTASALAAIHNLADLALWTSGGSHAKPVFKFTPNANAGGSLSKYRLRIYDAAVGGSTVYDSGEVAQVMTNGAQFTVNCSHALVNGTEYWWTIDVYDGYEWAGESSRTGFKVRWAQGLFEHDTGGSSSTNWAMATGTIVESAALIFRSATSSGGDAATGKSAFFASMASVPTAQWMQVCVRLSTDSAGVDATLADMTFSYYGTPSTPDGWSVS